MNNQDYHVHHGQTFLTLQESLLTNFQLIRKDIADPPRIQGYPSSKPSVSGSYHGKRRQPHGNHLFQQLQLRLSWNLDQTNFRWIVFRKKNLATAIWVFSYFPARFWCGGTAKKTWISGYNWSQNLKFRFFALVHFCCPTPSSIGLKFDTD